MAAPTWQFDPFAVPVTVSCDNECDASVAPVDDPVQQHTLGNSPGYTRARSLRDASCAQAAARRFLKLKTVSGHSGGQFMLTWFFAHLKKPYL